MPDLNDNAAAALPSREVMRGFNAVLGFRLVEWSDGRAVVELDIDERHLNRSGILHGGVQSSLLDATLGFCGVYTTDPGRKRRALTLSMTISYLGQVKSGRIRCVAERRGGGKTVYMATGSIRSADGVLLAEGQGVYRHIADETLG